MYMGAKNLADRSAVKSAVSVTRVVDPSYELDVRAPSTAAPSINASSCSAEDIV